MLTNRRFSRLPQLVKTLIDQGHLCPLPLHVRPVYWQHDQVKARPRVWTAAMPPGLCLYSMSVPACLTLPFFFQALWLNPLPTVLVLADRFDSYNLTYEVCWR